MGECEKDGTVITRKSREPFHSVMPRNGGPEESFCDGEKWEYESNKKIVQYHLIVRKQKKWGSTENMAQSLYKTRNGRLRLCHLLQTGRVVT